MSIQPRKKLIIGLFGFGVVGEGLYHVIQQTSSLNAAIRKICIKHPEKERNAPSSLFTVDPEELLNDDEINVIVELTNDAAAAFHIATNAFKNGKTVVSANKKMIADNLSELLFLQQHYKQPFLYEAAVCASIPIIRNLEEYYDNDLLQSVSGIVNGSTNYILTKVFEEKMDFSAALLSAQFAGFAETDATLDVEGIDAVNKLTILLAHAYGVSAQPAEIVHSGIQYLQPGDASFAREKQWEIKLVAQAKKVADNRICAFVLPQFIDAASQLYHVKDEYNGVIIESNLADKQFFYGKGAGGYPTASAVLSDISALRYDYRYGYKKIHPKTETRLSDDFSLKVYVSFEKLFHVPQEAFVRILEWNSTPDRCYVIGIVHFSALKKNNWWRKKGTSLIVLPDPFVCENDDLYRISEEYELSAAV